MSVRLVVTGHDDDGHAVVISDDVVPGVTSDVLGGGEMARLWGADMDDDRPAVGYAPTSEGWLPAPHQVRFGVFSVAPGTVFAGAGREHRTDSLDFVTMLEGELTMTVGTAGKVVLRAGDTLVQQGTRHAWLNEGSDTARASVVLIGVDRQALPRRST